MIAELKLHVQDSIAIFLIWSLIHASVTQTMK